MFRLLVLDVFHFQNLKILQEVKYHTPRMIPKETQKQYNFPFFRLNIFREEKYFHFISSRSFFFEMFFCNPIAITILILLLPFVFYFTFLFKTICKFITKTNSTKMPGVPTKMLFQLGFHIFKG